MIVESSFRPAPWLRGPHGQTIYACKARAMPALATEVERLELPDGDFLELAWLPAAGLAYDAPVIVVLHGLTGSIESKYARGLLQRVAARGWRGVLMHFRGAGAEPNRLPRGYHSGDTADFAALVATLRARFPAAPLAAVGYSLGGNVLLKYLGERGAETPLATGVAVSVPFDLAQCVETIDSGLRRAYQWHLITHLRTEVERKFAQVEPPFPLPDLRQLRNFSAFDDALTAPLNGFADAADYYDRASCGPYLKRIAIDTLVLHAADDPFMVPEVIPEEHELGAPVRLEISQQGGHVGFVAADRRLRPVFWLEQRIPAWLDQYLT